MIHVPTMILACLGVAATILFTLKVSGFMIIDIRWAPKEVTIKSPEYVMWTGEVTLFRSYDNVSSLTVTPKIPIKIYYESHGARWIAWTENCNKILSVGRQNSPDVMVAMGRVATEFLERALAYQERYKHISPEHLTPKVRGMLEEAEKYI